MNWSALCMLPALNKVNLNKLCFLRPSIVVEKMGGQSQTCCMLLLYYGRRSQLWQPLTQWNVIYQAQAMNKPLQGSNNWAWQSQWNEPHDHHHDLSASSHISDSAVRTHPTASDHRERVGGVASRSTIRPPCFQVMSCLLAISAVRFLPCMNRARLQHAWTGINRRAEAAGVKPLSQGDLCPQVYRGHAAFRTASRNNES